MKLQLGEFRSRLAANSLHLALVGMSNSGKSTCTKVLTEELDFDAFEVDESINRELDIGDMAQAARWMGYPFDDCYADNKKKYLDLESKYSRVKIPEQRNFVLDTTGSIIYADEELLDWIRDHFLIVGLKVSDQLCQTLVDDYFVHPKTVIWGDEFSPLSGEDGIDALKRCYPRLLENRSVLYSQLADIEIPADVARSPELNANLLIAEIEKQLDE